MTEVRTPPLLILVAVTAIGPFALNLIMPAMPAIADDIQADYGAVQLTLSLFLATLAICQLAYGPLSDKYGRRAALLAGLGLYTLGSLICAVAPNIEWLIGGRIVQAAGGCAGMVLARAMIRDTSTTGQSAQKIAYVTMAMLVAPMVAPYVGGWLATNADWRWAFVLPTVGGALVWLSAGRWAPETLAERRPDLDLSGMIRSFRVLLAQPGFIGFTVLIAATGATFFGFLGGAPYVIVELMGATEEQYGIYFFFGAIGYMGGNAVAGRFSERVGLFRMLTAGTLLALLGALIMLWLALAGYNHPLAIFAPMAVLAFGNGMTIPNGIAGAISVLPRLAGPASGLSGFVQMSAGATASAVVGAILTDSAVPMLLVMVGSCVLAVSILPLLRSQRLGDIPGAERNVSRP